MYCLGPVEATILMVERWTAVAPQHTFSLTLQSSRDHAVHKPTLHTLSFPYISNLSPFPSCIYLPYNSVNWLVCLTLKTNMLPVNYRLLFQESTMVNKFVQIPKMSILSILLTENLCTTKFNTLAFSLWIHFGSCCNSNHVGEKVPKTKIDPSNPFEFRILHFTNFSNITLLFPNGAEELISGHWNVLNSQLRIQNKMQLNRISKASFHFSKQLHVVLLNFVDQFIR